MRIMAWRFGHDSIPNPLLAEIRTLENKLDTSRKEAEKERLDFKKNIAMRHKCDVSQVTLEGGGHATVFK